MLFNLATTSLGFIVWILLSVLRTISNDGCPGEFSYANYMKFLEIDPSYVNNKYLPEYIRIRLHRKSIAGGRGTQLYLDRPDTWANFDPEQLTQIIVHGFVAGAETTQVTRIRDAYLLDYDNNVITVDWAPLAGTDIDSTDQYILSIAFMNDLVAPFVVKYVEFMTGSLATPTANIHLIGHSLGAHLMAIVAKKTKVYWVTGLDPANPGYSKQETENRLAPTDATVVEVIHTNVGGYGEEWACGTVDYYINSGGPTQPHCQQDDKQASHAYSYIVYSCAIESHVIHGTKCPSEEVAMQGKCGGLEGVARLADPKAPPGIYWVKTSVPFINQVNV